MRYRFKQGEVELEIEYTKDEIPDDQVTMISELLGKMTSALSGESQVESPLNGANSKSGVSEKRKDRRGGKRKGFVSPAIDTLIEKKWLVEKTTDEIIKELKRTGTFGAGKKNVETALRRKLSSRSITRYEKDGKTIWTIPSSA